MSGRIVHGRDLYRESRPGDMASVRKVDLKAEVCPDVFDQPVRPPVAQRTEQLPSKRSAVGSTPTGRAKVSKDTPDAGGGAVDHEPAAPAPAPDPPGLAMARSLDLLPRRVFAAFVVCRSGRERQMRRISAMHKVLCNGSGYQSFEAAWEAN